MKLRMKALAAASMLAVSGMAFAAIDNGTTGNGELFLMAFDTTSQTTYSFDTGLLMSAFVPGSASYQSFSLTDFSSFLAGATASTVRWGVYAVDALAPKSIYTTALTLTPATNPNQTQLGNVGGKMQSFINGTNPLGTHASSANGFFLQTAAPSSATDPTYGGNMVGTGTFANNLKFDTTGSLTDALSFFMFSNPNAGTSTRTVFGDTWKLDSATGILSYAVIPTSPTPEPGTYALMLAGLLTLGAVARRRTK